MRVFWSTLLLATAVLADKPAVAPAYVAPAAAAAADSYGSPQAAPSQDSYGSPQAAPQTDTYGSPAAPPVAQDEYGSPAAPVVSAGAASPAAAAAPVGNQGYYYYYYPVKQHASVQANQADDGGLFGDLGGLIGALLGKKILLLALGITGFLVLTALGINFSLGLGRSLEDVTARAMPYLTPDNLSILADFVDTAITTYENL